MCREAFAAWIPAWGVPFSYAVAISYVLVDTGDKGVAAYREAQAELGGAAVGAGVNVSGWVPVGPASPGLQPMGTGALDGAVISDA
jgi:hypothetical protein